MIIKRILNYIRICMLVFTTFVLNRKKVNEHWVNHVDSTHTQFSEEKGVPKIIWMYWESSNKNYLVEECIQQVQRVCPDFKLNVLNKKTVTQYIEIPNFNKSLEVAHIADFIRLSLLEKYGGIWVDASIFLTEDFNWFLKRLKDEDVFLFFSDECTLDLKKPIAENWFIAASKGNLFIHDWLSEYRSCIESRDPFSYYDEVVCNNPLLIQNIKNPSYLICYIAAIMVTERKNYNILYVNSGSVGHYYNYRYRFNSLFIALDLLIRCRDKVFVPKLIKFTKHSRKWPNFFLKYKIYSRYSIFGSFICQEKKQYTIFEDE